MIIAAQTNALQQKLESIHRVQTSAKDHLLNLVRRWCGSKPVHFPDCKIDKRHFCNVQKFTYVKNS